MEVLEKEINLENKEKTKILKENSKSRILKNNLIFLIGIIILVYKGLFLNNLLELQISINTFFYTIVASLLIMCPVINKKNRFGYIYLNIIYAIVTLIIYADFLYYNYSTNFLSFYQIC